MVQGFYTPSEEAVVTEIRSWSNDVIETENDNFSGLPACPHARSAWENEKVNFVFKTAEGYQDLYTVISTYNFDYDLVILVDFKYEKDPKAFHEYILGLNSAISTGMFLNPNCWLVGFHPEDEKNELLSESLFPTKTDTPYAMIFVQPLSLVQESADKLRSLGYYKNYQGVYDAETVYQNRETLYRRLKDGDESA